MSRLSDSSLILTSQFRVWSIILMLLMSEGVMDDESGELMELVEEVPPVILLT